MAYTPELDRTTVAFVRRVAWAAGKPMAVALEALVRCAAQHVELAKVCAACKDSSKCALCTHLTVAVPALDGLARLLKVPAPANRVGVS